MHSDNPRVLANEDDDFYMIYWWLSEEGWCDAPGAGEYQRVREEWETAGRPPITPFIKRRANSVDVEVPLPELN